MLTKKSNLSIEKIQISKQVNICKMCGKPILCKDGECVLICEDCSNKKQDKESK